MYLQTSFSTSISAYLGTLLSPFQGKVQGNGTALVLWLIISIILIRYLYILGLVSQHHTPILGYIFSLVALVHIDNLDLNIFNSNRKSTLEVIEEAQVLLNV